MYKRVGILILAMLLCIGTSAFAQAQPALNPNNEGAWPRIDGSTATIPLHEAVSAHFLGQPVEEVTHTHSTTPDAYDALRGAEADLILVTYPAPEDLGMIFYDGELSIQQRLDAYLDDNFELVPVAKDALVFLVNQQNPVGGLNLEQLRAIYTGTCTNWQEVGGAVSPIVAYQRPDRSGSQTLFLKLLMGDVQPMQPPTDWLPFTMGDLVKQVAGYDNARNALGYSVFYYVHDMFGMDNIRLIAVDGVPPTAQTIASGEYPLCTYYYAVFDKNEPEDSPTRRLVEWMLTDEGQRVIEQAGYVPLREFPEEGQPLTPEEAEKQAEAARDAQWARTDSLGTGGNVSRYEEEPVICEIEQEGWGFAAPEFADSITVNILGRPETARAVEQWRAKTCAELEPDVQETAFASGNLLNLAMRGSKGFRTAVFDLQSGMELELSDLFYDRVNYIAVINQFLADGALRDGRTILDADFWTYGRFENMQYAPFGGFPRDHRLFHWTDGGVLLYMDDATGFMIPVAGGVGEFVLWVPFNHKLSPYAGCRISVTYETAPFGQGAGLPVPRVHIDGGAYPQAEEAINAAARAMADRITGSPTLAARWTRADVEPWIRRHAEYVSLHYQAYAADTTPPDPLDSPVIGGAIFVTHTGAQVDPAPIVEAWNDAPEARYYAVSGADESGRVILVSEKPQLKEAVVTDAWLADDLIIRLIDQMGREIRLALPLEALDRGP